MFIQLSRKNSTKFLEILSLMGIGFAFSISPVRAVATYNANTFSYVPNGEPGNIEGLTVDPTTGNVIGASLDQTIGSANENLYTWNSNGNLLKVTPFVYTLPQTQDPPLSQWPIGNTVVGDNLYQIDILNGNLVDYTLTGNRLPSADNISNVWHICGGFSGGPDPICGLNDVAMGPDKNLYITDNANAAYGDTESAVYRLNPTTGQSAIWLTSPLINPAPYVPGAPGSANPYGANGIMFNNTNTAMFIANTNLNSVTEVPLTGCSNATTGAITGGCKAGTPFTFASGGPLGGPDNMAFDPQGNLWVANDQNNDVVEYSPTGQVIGIVYGYNGLAPAPGGGLAADTLAEPSGVVYNQGKIYISNEQNCNLTNQSIVPGVSTGEVCTNNDPVDFANLSRTTVAYINVPEPINVFGGLLTLGLGLTLKRQLKK